MPEEPIELEPVPPYAGTQARPIADAPRRGPSVTRVIILLNIASFLVMAGFFHAGWITTEDMTPYVKYGANNAAATTDGQWWRLFTSLFLHYGALHLAFNMWALSQAGDLLERIQGRARFLFTYLASGLGGGLLSMLWHGDKVWSAGASGAIFGVCGAILGYALREKGSLPRAVFAPLVRSTLTFAGYNLLFGAISSAVDNSSHVGGLVSGLAVGWLIAPPRDPVRRSEVGARRVVQAVLFVAAMTVAGVMAAPRYAYSVADELAWEEVVGKAGTAEKALLSDQDQAIKAWQKDPSKGAALAHLLQTRTVPFYERLLRDLKAQHLAPGRATDRRRKILVAFVSQRLAAYPHLIQAAQTNDPAEAERFSEMEKDADKMLGDAKDPD